MITKLIWNLVFFLKIFEKLKWILIQFWFSFWFNFDYICMTAKLFFKFTFTNRIQISMGSIFKRSLIDKNKHIIFEEHNPQTWSTWNLKRFLSWCYPKSHRFWLPLRKKCPYSNLFWSAFSRIRTEYREIQGISQCWPG